MNKPKNHRAVARAEARIRNEERRHAEDAVIAALEIRPMTGRQLAEKTGIARYLVDNTLVRLRKRGSARISGWKYSMGGAVAVFGLGSRPDAEKPKSEEMYVHPDNRLPHEAVALHRLFDRCHAAGVRAVRGTNVCG